jgi:hypothetical protein
MASDNLLANLQNRNVPIQSEGVVPNDELVHRPILSKRISKKKIEELSIQQYRIYGIISTIEQNVLLRFHELYYFAK